MSTLDGFLSSIGNLAGGIANSTKDTADFIGSIGKSDFAKQTSKGFAQKSAGFLENGIFGAGIFASHLGLGLFLPPVAAVGGAVAIGLGIRHQQNKRRGVNKVRSSSRKITRTALTVTGAAIGSVLIGGPLGIALGAVAGRVSAPVIAKASPKSLNSKQSLNRFTTATNNLPFLPNRLRFSFKRSIARPTALGCGPLIILAALGFFTLAAIFFKPNESVGVIPTDTVAIGEGCWPILGEIRSTPSQHPTERQYPGLGGSAVDIANTSDTVIPVPFSGCSATFISHRKGYGNHIDLVCPQGRFIFAHMSAVSEVFTDDSGRPLPIKSIPVGIGDVLGLVGSTGNSTGNHLHLELVGGKGNDIYQVFTDPGKEITTQNRCPPGVTLPQTLP